MGGGLLLSAIAQDTKNHIFPIAFCVVDKENDASWIFFFEKLKSIVEDKPDLCVISDRHISIVNAFSRVYSRAHHELCMRNVAENLHVNQHCGEHLYLFYAAVKTYSFNEFSKHFSKLKNNCPETAHVLENMLDFDKERHAFFGISNNKFVPFAEKILKKNKSATNSLFVTNVNEDLDQFTVFGNGVITKVNFLERSCSCRKYDLVKLSYKHTMAALRAKYGDDEDYGNSIYDYSSPIYKVETYLLAYSESINIVFLESE
ncbi:uncharacterized protein LOC124887870 [Capsicum annuum]|uniref:uncharacterized protein LOC124887870 n=1 Tax=Capsicum annuum TaxID=4072 RepID=UPI001FB11F43|nr:uncharacterized protein LOC124887870 [Capsicum annuum]